MGNQYDYRQLREFINANHDRFSELNYNSSMSMQQKIDGLIEWFKVMLKEYNEWVEYLDEFKEKFDNDLYETTDKILDEWVKSGLFDTLINKGVINSFINSINDKIDAQNNILLTKVDKGGEGQFSWGMADQDFRDKVLGVTPPAVVGKDAVLSENIVNGAVAFEKLSNKFDLLKNYIVKKDGQYVRGITSDNKNEYFDNEGFWYVKCYIPISGKVVIPNFTESGMTSAGIVFSITDINDNVLAQINYVAFNAGFSSTFAKNQGETIELDTNQINLLYPQSKYIYISISKVNNDSAFAYVENGVTMKRLDYISNKESNNLENIINNKYIAKKISYHDTLLVGKYLTTGKVQYSQLITTRDTENIYQKLTMYCITELKGKLVIKKPNYPSEATGHFAVFSDKDDNAIGLVLKSDINNLSESYFTYRDDEIICDLDSMVKFRPSMTKLFINIDSKTAKGVEPYIIDGFKESEIFPFLRNKEKTFIELPEVKGIIGKKCYLCLDNVLKNKKTHDKVLTNSTTNEENLNIVHTGSQNVTLNFMNETKILELRAKENKRTSVNLIVFGESTAFSYLFRQGLENQFENYGVAPTFQGTVGAGTKDNPYHEGRSGWTTRQYLTTGLYNGVKNAFFNPSTNKFDFYYYKEQNGISNPDIFLMSIGINNASQKIFNTQTIADFNEIINAVKNASPETKIIIDLPNTPSRWDFYDNQYLLSETRERIKMLNNDLVLQFKNKESENIFISLGGFSVDTLWDMQYNEQSISEFNSTKILKGASRITIDGADGNVHLGASGNLKKAYMDVQTILYALN